MSKGQRFALDIETIPTCDDPDFSDPRDWRPFAIVLAAEFNDRVDVDVMFRTSNDLADEAHLYARMLNWILIRIHGENPQILTYNGCNYDLPIIRHRFEKIDEELGTSLSDRLESIEHRSEHVDLLQIVTGLQGHRMSIDDVLAMLMIDYDVPRWPDGSKVTGEDMLNVGPKIVAQDIDPSVLDAAKRYAASDVEPLFEVHDALLRRRRIVDE